MSFSEEELQEFNTEATELLETAEKNLLNLDNGGNFNEIYDAVFRCLHNLKGSAGMMELDDLQAHTHSLESIFTTFKDKDGIPPNYVNFFLNGIDATHSILNGEDINFSYEVEGESPVASEASSSEEPTDTQEDESTESEEYVEATDENVDALAEIVNEAKSKGSSDTAEAVSEVDLSKLHNEIEAASTSTSANNNSNEEESLLPESARIEFLNEGDEIIDRFSKNLRVIESGEYDQDVINEFYRDIHSLKGGAYLVDRKLLGDISHAIESSLEPIRDNTHKPNKELIDILYKAISQIELDLACMRHDLDNDCIHNTAPVLISELEQAAKKLEEIDSAPKEVAEVEAQEAIQQNNKEEEIKSSNKEETTVVEIITPTKVSESPMENNIKVKEEESNSIESKPLATNNDKPDTTKKQAPVSIAKDANSSIRVSVSLLDNLMNLMGEMVLVRNQVLQFSSKSEDSEFLNLSQRLNIVTSEIQNDMMKTRMQPVGNILNKFHRVVRDLSQELGKKISVELFGAETELDKTLLEAIKDPLTHIVRNSCDHGIESIEDRKEAGKSEDGKIVIRSYHEGGQVIIEVTDNGKGLHPDAISKKAIEKGLVTEEQVANMNNKEIFNLIFAAGFSTAAKITNVSGRGVGMDVVKTNIEKIGGNVDIDSEPGKSTCIRLKIPLTLAIIPALMVKSCEHIFAIPQAKLVELVRVDSSSEGSIEYLQKTPIFRLRGQILPLINLSQVIDDEKEINEEEGINIAVLNADNNLFGLVINEIHDTAEIVVKPLSNSLKSLDIYSGATILGDGSVALILDVVGIARAAQAYIDAAQENSTHSRQSQHHSDISGNSEDYLTSRKFLYHL